MFVNIPTEKLTSFGKGKCPTFPSLLFQARFGFCIHNRLISGGGAPQKAPSGLEEIRPGFYDSHFGGERDSDSPAFHNLILLPAQGDHVMPLVTGCFQTGE